jgi:UDP-glucose 4-epimerase
MSPLHGPALVTGSSGFLGGHLVARLAREGVAVTGLDFAEPRQPLPAGVHDLRIDVRDVDAVQSALHSARPEVVYHLAAQASVSVSMREPVTDIETNVLGTLHLARAAAVTGARRLVFVSTGGALFGDPATVPVTEEMRTAPASVYGASKLAAEQYLAVLGQSTPMTVSVARPGNIFGPAQDPHGEAGVVAIFTERMLRGDPVTIFGDGSQQRDYVYVEDVVEACIRAATGAPATCLVGTGVGTSTQAIFDALAKLTGYAHRPQYGPERPGDIQRIWLDSARARQTWDWAPQVTFDEGMARTVEWFKARTDQA